LMDCAWTGSGRGSNVLPLVRQAISSVNSH